MAGTDPMRVGSASLRQAGILKPCPLGSTLGITVFPSHRPSTFVFHNPAHVLLCTPTRAPV